MNKALFPLGGALLSLAGAAWAQAPAAPVNANATPPAMFPFVLPWDDAAPGTITDVSFLNAKPAGVNGDIVPKNGHFVESKTGKRVRFIGTNFAAKAAFPSHADAEKVAARIAKLGINLVRMHHMDNTGWGPGATLWDTTVKDRQHIDPAQLDKLDYLIAQFKKNGVYANINLHVSRQFSEADGFPASVNSIPDFDKRVDEFDRRMILLQKNYARDLLTHVNPYTHLSYAQDPAVAVVEINNENSLVGDGWAGTYGTDLDTLPEPFRGELVGFWNDWLAKKYGTDAKVQAAWTAGLTPTGPALLTQTAPWSTEHQGRSQAELIQSPPDPMKGGPFPADGGGSRRRGARSASDVQVNITQTDGTDWHVQAHQTGLNLTDGTTYTVSFRAKADRARAMPVSTGLDQADWHNVGLQGSAALTTDWKTFRYVFTAHDTVPNHNRIAFTLGGQTGTVWIGSLQIHPGAEGAGLQPGQSLLTKTVDIPTAALKAQHDDWIAFLAGTERSYAEEMRAYLKNDLHVRANVLCSQMGYGGLTSLTREANMDFADNHAYWQHPSFPHKAWDVNDWTIPNTPMVADLADGKGGTLQSLAEYRVAGKPYSVSEYNHPAPNDYRAETLPELATFAAFQDWDMIYLFDYGDYGAEASNDKINGYFGISSDPAKTAFLPAAALIFRAGEFAPTPTKRDKSIFLSGQDVGRLLTAGAAWKPADSTDNSSLFSRRLAISFSNTAQEATGLALLDAVPSVSIFLPPPPPPPLALFTAKTPAGGQYLAVTPSAQAVVGYVGGQTVTLGANTLTFPAFGNNFAAVTLTPKDQDIIVQSHKLLLTLVGKVENQDMGWNADRTSVGSKWGNGPTVAEGIPATVTLKTRAARHVWALDGTGKRVGDVPATFANGALTFTVGPQFKTLWYEIGE